MNDRAPLRAALGHQNVRAFLAVIDLGEHGPNAESLDRYRTIYGGEKFDAPPWEHPRRKVTAGEWTSSAAGRGQFLAATWDGLVKQYGFPDFSPACQDEAMVALIIGRGALEDVLAGRLEAALAKCSKEWASLPGSPYGQPTITLDDARWRYLARGGQLSGTPGLNPDTLATEHYGEAVTESTITPIPSADQQEEHNMAAPLIPIAIAAAQAFLPRLIELIPTLGAAFGSGSEVQKRNVAAAAMVAEAVTKAVGEPNLQSAIESMQRNPEKLAEARAAVGDILPTLVEVGGGVAAARKSSEPFQSAEWWRFLAVPQTWFGFLLLGLVYLAMGNVTGLFGFQGWTPELRSNVVFAIVGVAIGSVSGYYFGTSSGSARKTDLLSNTSRE